MDDMRDRLEQYMGTEVNKGYKPEVIRNVLLSKGYSTDIVNSIYEKYRSDPEKKYNKILISLLSIIIIISITIGVFVFFGSNECQTASCFIDKANECKEAKYTINEDGTTYYFETEGCRIKKSVSKVSDEEPYVIKEMFEGKEMTCTYPKGDFDERILTTLLSGLENCKGELKDSLYELAIAQYELTLEEYELG